MRGLDALQALPVWGVVALVALAVVQIVLDVVALVDLYRRPADRLTIANKWVWVAIVLLVSTVGAIIYLVVGRKPAIAVEAAPERPTTDRAAAAADVLYGAPKDVEPR